MERRDSPRHQDRKVAQVTIVANRLAPSQPSRMLTRLNMVTQKQQTHKTLPAALVALPRPQAGPIWLVGTQASQRRRRSVEDVLLLCLQVDLPVRCEELSENLIDLTNSIQKLPAQ